MVVRGGVERGGGLKEKLKVGVDLVEVWVVVERGGVPNEKVGMAEEAGESKEKVERACGAAVVERGGVPKEQEGWLEVGEIKEGVLVDQAGVEDGGTMGAAGMLGGGEVGGEKGGSMGCHTWHRVWEARDSRGGKNRVGENSSKLPLSEEEAEGKSRGCKGWCTGGGVGHRGLRGQGSQSDVRGVQAKKGIGCCWGVVHGPLCIILRVFCEDLPFAT